MKTDEIIRLGLCVVAMAVIVFAVEAIRMRQPCFDIIKSPTPYLSVIKFDKCNGRTWTLVQDETTFSELGYNSEGENDKFNTLVWVTVPHGNGVYSTE